MLRPANRHIAVASSANCFPLDVDTICSDGEVPTVYSLPLTRATRINQLVVCIGGCHIMKLDLSPSRRCPPGVCVLPVYTHLALLQQPLYPVCVQLVPSESSCWCAQPDLSCADTTQSLEASETPAAADRAYQGQASAGQAAEWGLVSCSTWSRMHHHGLFW